MQRRPRLGPRIAAGLRILVMFAASERSRALWSFIHENHGDEGAHAARAALDYCARLARWFGGSDETA